MNIFKLFQKKIDRLRIKTLVDLSNSASTDMLSDLIEEQSDVLILKDALTKEQINFFKETLENQENPDEAFAGVVTYPGTFSSPNRKQFELNQMALFEKPSCSIITSVLEKLAFEKKVEVVKDKMNQQITYPPFVIKKIVPPSGEFSLHCGRMFHPLNPEYFKGLAEISDIKNQLSFFFMLQEAEEGGILKIYNIREDYFYKKASETVLFSRSNEEIDINSKKVDRLEVHLEPGDLIVFKGANLWHSVSQVKGKVERITVGGFISRSKENESYYIWN